MSAPREGNTHTQKPGVLRLLTNEDFDALEPLVWRGRTLEDGVKMVIIAVRELLMRDAEVLPTAPALTAGEREAIEVVLDQAEPYVVDSYVIEVRSLLARCVVREGETFPKSVSGTPAAETEVPRT